MWGYHNTVSIMHTETCFCCYNYTFFLPFMYVTVASFFPIYLFSHYLSLIYSQILNWKYTSPYKLSNFYSLIFLCLFLHPAVALCHPAPMCINYILSCRRIPFTFILGIPFSLFWVGSLDPWIPHPPLSWNNYSFWWNTFSHSFLSKMGSKVIETLNAWLLYSTCTAMWLGMESKMDIIFPLDFGDISLLSSKFQFSIEKCKSCSFVSIKCCLADFAFFFLKVFRISFCPRALKVYNNEYWFKSFGILQSWNISPSVLGYVLVLSLPLFSHLHFLFVLFGIPITLRGSANFLIFPPLSFYSVF